MTVAAAAAKAGPYTGNGSASAFAFSFKVFADADIRVVKTIIATGVESDFVLNTDYTVARNADQDTSPGGTVTYKVGGVTTALPSTLKLTIVGDFDYAQPTDIPNGGSFFASVIETAFDRVTLLIKQLKEQSSRALVFPVSDDDPTVELPTDRASKYLAFDADGNPVATSGTVSPAVISAFMETVLDDANAAAARATLGLIIGTDVQAQMTSASQAEMEAGTEAALRSMSPLLVAQAIAALAVKPGMIFDYGGSAAPTGYLACDGASYLRADYPALFTAIGTLWGAADGTHFNVPNFAAGDAAVQTAGTVGASTDGQMPAHTHPQPSGTTGFWTYTDSVGSSVTAGASALWLSNAATATGSTGSGTRNFAAGKYVLKCIKT